MEKLTKICTKCNCEKELTEFSFRKDTNDYRKQCKQCRCNHSKVFRALHLDECRANEKRYDSLNRESRINYAKGYRVTNKDIISEKKKEYAVRNNDVIVKRRRQHYIENKEVILKKNFDYIKSNKGRLVKKNISNKRRAKYKDGDVTNTQLRSLYKTEKNCYWCNCELEENNTHLDHFFPLSKGGKHTVSNLVLACSSCNLSKGAKHPIDFAKELDVIPHDLEFIL